MRFAGTTAGAHRRWGGERCGAFLGPMRLLSHWRTAGAAVWRHRGRQGAPAPTGSSRVGVGVRRLWWGLLPLARHSLVGWAGASMRAAVVGRDAATGKRPSTCRACGDGDAARARSACRIALKQDEQIRSGHCRCHLRCRQRSSASRILSVFIQRWAASGRV